MDAAAPGPEGPSRPVPEPSAAADPLRADRLARLRAMIDDGSYETEERLEAAVSRLLSSIGDGS